MENARAKNTIYFYRIKFKSKLAKFNLPLQLPDYFEPMISDKKEITIAEPGAGPICTIGNSWKDIKVKIYASDILQNEFAPWWKRYGAVPIVPVECQDMEHLTYPDEFFDIVHCVNAVDHSLDARQALEEIFRICKPGGWIYLRHYSNQRKRYRGMHEWDIDVIGGECVFSSPKEKFLLSEFGDFKTTVEETPKDNLITSILCKI
ncbi:MAG: class I SAM-dependent methyltransferase [Candidatus Wolfebacteria bacterium]|nr:class I SAM-dependent methyltransferase [Candidatus Wolfebacteria bacterium]